MLTPFNNTISKASSLLLFILLGASFLSWNSDKDWKLEKNKNGILVYTLLPENESIKQIRMITTSKAKLSTAIAVLMDVESYTEWIYNCTYAKSVKQVSDHEMIYYSITNAPWPIEDRDLVLYNEIHQHPKTMAVYSVTETKLNLIPEKKNYVRIKTMKGVWKFTPKKDGVIGIEYYLQVDPGGKLPPWVINMFITAGPYQTMVKYKAKLNEEKYKKVKVDFIQNN